ncbi:polysaccharide deacetylase family protein [Dethiobacter alkaliphilus]|uniref:polysaccharide deacetylase family protein n=1 Tax=Dethiobacter alkaliphilus TaxID=427926 RepID=UPI002227D2E3|nr:polysaccharide deacetylase family protein [Dethiobacter alkaliphilus]MCW3490830.1 polysaccharide deacetylase family protein [Dethiobacter alkaliphilus]
MRYRYFNVLNGRQLIVILILLGMLLLVFQGYRRINHYPKNIRQNVFFAGSNLGGLTPQEAEAVIYRLSEEKAIPPVEAVLDPETNGVIPELNGLEVDVAATLQQIVEAEENSEVQPVYREIPPAVTLADFPERPLYQGNPAKPQVAFLVNVAWGNEYLQEMLDVLEQEKAQATFFLVGRWARANEEDAKSIVDAGFAVANHGYSDAISMANATYEQAKEDIKAGNDAIEEVTGKRPAYFSPHKGELNANVLKAAAEENCRLILWTVDTVDWMLPGVDVMVDKILSKSQNGSLILMHPTEQTADFLREVIPQLRSRGLEPVTLAELLSPSRPEKDVAEP